MPWFILNISAIGMAIGLLINPSLHKPFLTYTGWISLGLFLFLLALNPYIKMLPLKFPSITKFARFCNRFRAELGVSSFVYACLHFVCFIVKRGSIKATIPYFAHPGLIPGWISLCIFLALSITSNKYFIKKMGFVRWKKLHTKVYIVEWLIVVHLVLLRHFYLALCFIPLMILQSLRRKERKLTLKNKNPLPTLITS